MSPIHIYIIQADFAKKKYFQEKSLLTADTAPILALTEALITTYFFRFTRLMKEVKLNL